MSAKNIPLPQLAGLAVGTGLAASIHFGIRLIPFEGLFFSYAGILYFFTGMLFGCLVPALSWKGGIWITLPWIVRTFFVIAGTGFKEGIPAGMGLLLLKKITLWRGYLNNFRDTTSTARLETFTRY